MMMSVPFSLASFPQSIGLNICYPECSILILLNLWSIAISWVSPLIGVLLLELLLDLVSLLNKGVEKINVVKVRVQVLFSDFKLLKQVGSEIVFGNLWERETFLHLCVSHDFDLIKLFLWHFIVLSKVLFQGDSSIKISFSE
jgi:hypothetical protein